ncbi:MAG TPA: hypothetical protein VGE77_06420 [Nocardioides sp.]
MTTTPSRSAITGLGAMAGFTGIALGLGAINRLVALALDRTMEVRLEATPSAGASVASDAGDLPLTETLTVAVPVGELATSTVAVLATADLVLALGALAATFLFATALNHVVDSRLDSHRGVRLLTATLVTLAATFVVSGVGSMVGAALATGDLGLTKFDNGITFTTILAALGALGVVWMLRHVLTRALRAEAETEGLV